MATPKEKEIVYKNAWNVVHLAIGWGFCLISIGEKYVAGSLFFGLCAVVFTWQFLDPRKKILFTWTSAYKEHQDKEFNERYTDLGIFSYGDDGFDVGIYRDLIESNLTVKWEDINAIFAYKMDQYTTDLVCLDIFCSDNKGFRITEDTPGWFVFADKLPAQFSTIDPQWFGEITVPAFETKLTLLYERNGLALADAEKLYYKTEEKTEIGPT